MAYTKTSWNNGAEPAITAERLNNLETQYDEAKKYVDTDTETVRDRSTISNTTDWDTLIKAGTYLSNGITMNATYKSPVGAGSYGTLHVFKIGTAITQLYVSDTQRAVDPTVNGSLWYRSNIGGVWGPWRALNSDNNIIPYIGPSTTTSAAGYPKGLSTFIINGESGWPYTKGVVTTIKHDAKFAIQYFHAMQNSSDPFNNKTKHIWTRTVDPNMDGWSDWIKIQQSTEQPFIEFTKANLAATGSAQNITSLTQVRDNTQDMNFSTGVFAIKEKGTYLVSIEAITPPFTGTIPYIAFGGTLGTQIVSLTDKNTRISRPFYLDVGNYYFRLGPGSGTISSLSISVVQM